MIVVGYNENDIWFCTPSESADVDATLCTDKGFDEVFAALLTVVHLSGPGRIVHDAGPCC